ncbi:MAG: hypothetical protein WCF59_02415 [Desulfobaccales bacterium]|jgi:hypothetical protein
MAGLEIIAAEGGSALKDFIDLPWEIYAGYPKWVPPLKKDVRRLLDPRRHPFWEFSERRLFLARRGSKTVGRIAGIIDRHYNELHSEKMGIWGFFECIDDPEAAAALFAAAETWVRQQGMDFIRGPLNPSLNYEAGLLIEGFDYPPVLGMTYNPPYYPRLVESCGFIKEKDLLAYLIEAPFQVPEWMDQLAERLAHKKGVRIRAFRPKDQDSEFLLIREIYNDSWSDNWGFVPISDNEIRDIQKEMMKFADPDLAFFIYFEEEPVAVCVVLPDLNPLLKRLNGRVGLLGLLKLLRYRGEIRGLRGFIFGVKEQYRQLGFPMLATYHLNEIVRKKGKYHYMEMGWCLEDNESINVLIEEAGVKTHKRYRLYRKSS